MQGQSPRQDLEVDFLGWWYIILVVLGASCWLQRKKDFSVKVFAFYLLLLLIVYIYYYTVINFIYHYIIYWREQEYMYYCRNKNNWSMHASVASV